MRQKISTQVLLGAACLAASQMLDISSFSSSSQFVTSCRCFPGDICWPSLDIWEAFNRTLGGKLVATVPIASPCHDTFQGVEYDPVDCAHIQKNWVDPQFHIESSHSTMAAFFANKSCDPFTDSSARCDIGSYVIYAVAATNVTDYSTTISFAREHNIRLVIRNTGHDYMGKSTGAGALALWTHHIKDITIFDFESPDYTGKAMKVGAGVQAGEAQDAANAQGYIVVEGNCPTVGIAGGYTQGGGTSPLASRFGLAADQVLEWEVVTADGSLLTASPSINSDLYWALSGGGGGTYGAVSTMTVKLYRNMQTAGASLQFAEPSNAYWNLLQQFLTNLPAVLDVGGTVYWMVAPGNVLAAPQIYLPGGSAIQLEQLFQPTLNALQDSGVKYEFVAKDYDNFQDAYHALNPQINVFELNIGGRLIQRSLIESSDASASLRDAIKFIVNAGAVFAGIGLNVSRAPPSANSAHPAWRDTLSLAFFGMPYDRTNFESNIAAQRVITEELGPVLEAITPGGGAYLNEANFNQPDWQNTFYGCNYPRLLDIKRKYDAEDIFWAQTAVGSENWKVAEDGRLCRV